MFAVLKTGGKQYRVSAGDVLRVELLAAEAGEKIQFNDVLMVGAQVGTPLVAGAAVQAEVIDTIKADKVITYHKRRRKHSSQRTRGHRQQLTLVRVTDILETGAEASGIKAAVGTALARRVAHADAQAAAASAPAAASAASAEGDAAVAEAPAKKAAAKPAKPAKKPAVKKPAAKKE
jgi:large subunit ribosomal protein L21